MGGTRIEIKSTESLSVDIVVVLVGETGKYTENTP